jgi:hypothetical protein
MNMRLHYLIAAPLAGALLFLNPGVTQAQEREPGPVEVKPEPVPSQEVRRSEAEQMLGALKSMVRVAYSMTGARPSTLTGGADKGGSRVAADELAGRYCKVDDRVYHLPDDEGRVALMGEDTAKKDGFAILVFELATGDGKVKWYDSLDALKEAHKEVEFADKAEVELREACRTHLTSLRNQARVAFSKRAVAPETLTRSIDEKGSGAAKDDLTRDSYTVHDKVYRIKGDADWGALVAESTGDTAGAGVLIFQFSKPEIEFYWYGDLAALKKAHKDVDFGDKTTSSDDTDADSDEPDAWVLYRKEGRNWTYKMQGGITMKTTVKTVKDDYAEIETQVFMGGNAMGDPTVSKIEFSRPRTPKGEVPEAPKSIEKEVECKAGTFLCISYDDGDTWMHKKYPGLIVKSEFMELIEFNE